MKNVHVNMSPWTLRFEATAHLKREVSISVYGVILKVLCATAVSDVAEQQRAEDGRELIRSTPGILGRMRFHVRLRAVRKHKGNTSSTFINFFL
jgi:hypothetical protein